MRGIVFFPVLTAVMIGCGFGSHFFLWLIEYRMYLMVSVVVLWITVVGVWLVRSMRLLAIHSVLLVLAVFVTSLLYGMHRGAHARDPLLATYTNQSVDIAGVVVTDPEISGARQRFVVRVDRLHEASSHRAVHEKILVSVPRYPTIAYGDRVRLVTVIKTPEPFTTEYGRTFRYDTFLRSQKIGYVAYAQTIDRVAQNSASPILARLFVIKHALFDALSRSMHDPFQSIARAMVFGDKSGIPDTLEKKFQTTGLIHIMVLSGYNITIIAVALLAITRRLGKQFGIGVSAVAIIGFLLMTGFTPTSTRAGIMGAIGLIALGSYRAANPLRALMLAGAVMALINPLVILGSVSFQLSFVATFGLITLTPLCTFVRIPAYGGLREIIASTIATQIAVLPLLLGAMGMVSMTGLLVNVVVVPIVPLVMLLTIVTAVVGTVVVVPVVGLLPELLVRGIVWVVDMASVVDVISVASLGVLYGYVVGGLISVVLVTTLYLLRRKGLVY